MSTDPFSKSSGLGFLYAPLRTVLAAAEGLAASDPSEVTREDIAAVRPPFDTGSKFSRDELEAWKRIVGAVARGGDPKLDIALSQIDTHYYFVTNPEAESETPPHIDYLYGIHPGAIAPEDWTEIRPEATIRDLTGKTQTLPFRTYVFLPRIQYDPRWADKRDYYLRVD